MVCWKVPISQKLHVEAKVYTVFLYDVWFSTMFVTDGQGPSCNGAAIKKTSNQTRENQGPLINGGPVEKNHKCCSERAFDPYRESTGFLPCLLQTKKTWRTRVL